jgi:predicted NAD/FAD-dependent oxidoreductase
MDIGIVGAGAGGAAVAGALAGAAVDADVTLVEKSGGLCGRAATRRREGGYVYDYGANYVRSDDERVNELLTEVLDDDGLVDAREPVYTFDAEGTVSEGRDAEGHKWSYRSGLTQIAKRLLAGTDATVHRRTRVETVAREGEGWTLSDAEGGRYGPFDRLVLNPPAPQTADLLWDAEWDDERRANLAEAVADVPYRSIWTAVLGYGFRLDVPYYGLVNPGKDHTLGWVSREECKAGHVPDGESVLVAQANHEWSVEHYDNDPAENVAELAGSAAEVIGDGRLRDPAWSDHQGWRYALPDAGVERGPMAAAESAGLYCTGDWVAGEARVHAALRDGLETGERLARSL